MQTLLEGIRQFQENVFSKQRRLFERLVEGQQPLALFITCSDSRVCPNLLTQTEPGELFVLRNAGNIVPPYGPADLGEAATVEYAMRGLGIRHIIVCGHSHCAAIQSLFEPQRIENMPSVRQWLANVADCLEAPEQPDEVTSEQNWLEWSIKQHVKVQLTNLKTHPSVAERLTNGEVKLHGWFYKIETGEVSAFADDCGRFLPLV